MIYKSPQAGHGLFWGKKKGTGGEKKTTMELNKIAK